MRILVINESTDQPRPFAEMYQLFSNWHAAIGTASELGWCDPFNQGVNTKVGVMNTYASGDVRVSMIALEDR